MGGTAFSANMCAFLVECLESIDGGLGLFHTVCQKHGRGLGGKEGDRGGRSAAVDAAV